MALGVVGDFALLSWSPQRHALAVLAARAGVMELVCWVLQSGVDQCVPQPTPRAVSTREGAPATAKVFPRNMLESPHTLPQAAINLCLLHTDWVLVSPNLLSPGGSGEKDCRDIAGFMVPSRGFHLSLARSQGVPPRPSCRGSPQPRSSSPVWGREGREKERATSLPVQCCRMISFVESELLSTVHSPAGAVSLIQVSNTGGRNPQEP